MTRIDLTAGGKTTAFAKQGTDWKIVKPLDTRADFGAVEGLVGRLQSAQMKSIVAAEPTPEDLKKYGLDKPDTTVNLKAGSATATLVLGAKTPDNMVYARDAVEAGGDDRRELAGRRVEEGRGRIPPQGSLRVPALQRQPDRDHAAGRRPSSSSASRARAKTRRTNGAASARTAADADRDKVEGMLSRLSNMRASAFVESTAKTGLDKPAMTVLVKFDDGKKEERSRSARTATPSYASRPGEPGAVEGRHGGFHRSQQVAGRTRLAARDA